MSDGMFPPRELFEAEQARQRAAKDPFSGGPDHMRLTPEDLKRRQESAAALAADAVRRDEARTLYRERPEEFVRKTPGMSEAAQAEYLRSTAGERADIAEQDEAFVAEQKLRAEQALRDKFELEALRAGLPEDQWPAYVEKKLEESRLATAEPAIDTAAEAATEEETAAEEDPISKSIREAYEFGQVEADRAQRAFDAMQERQRLASEQVERTIAEAENELKNYSIDPKRAFKSTGSQVMAAFAMAIGAFAEGLSGGKVPNTALIIIDNAIKRDVEAQKAEMGKYTDVLKNKNNVYARMLQKFGNEEAAMKASITLGLSAAESSIDELVAKYGPDSKQAQVAAGFKARLAGDKAKLMLDLAKTNARILGKGKNTGQAAQLFKNALGEIGSLRTLFKELGEGEAALSQLIGVFGEEAQVSYSPGTASEYAAARFAVAQFVNKAFSGARGSDRDLAAVMARIPNPIIATLDRKKGLQLIKNLEESLTRAAGDKGYLVAGDVARQFDIDYGTKGTDDALKSFKPQIDSIRGTDQ
tara:strand:- start:17 stop:1609 length:1593 start_codon:yes stop_codon:yes gene_type:complete